MLRIQEPASRDCQMGRRQGRSLKIPIIYIIPVFYVIPSIPAIPMIPVFLLSLILIYPCYPRYPRYPCFPLFPLSPFSPVVGCIPWLVRGFYTIVPNWSQIDPSRSTHVNKSIKIERNRAWENPWLTPEWPKVVLQISISRPTMSKTYRAMSTKYVTNMSTHNFKTQHPATR